MDEEGMTETYKRATAAQFRDIVMVIALVIENR